MRHRGPIKPQLTVHPRTGKPIVPVGYINGRAIWPISGGAPDDPDDDDKDKDDTDSGGGDDDGGDADKDKDPSGDGDSKDTADRIADLEKRMRAADQRASKAEKALKDREDADKDELTRFKDRATELETTVGERDATIKQLRLENSFLTANKHTWHDPDVALDLAQSKGYLDDDIIDEDGRVDKVRLGKALDRLAKEKPFLVKTDKKDEEPGEPSGQPSGGRSDNAKDEKAKQQALRRRFPALNR